MQSYLEHLENIMTSMQKDQVYRAAMDAMKNGQYVTLIFYVRGIDKDYICGQTFNHVTLVEQWNGKNVVK